MVFGGTRITGGSIISNDIRRAGAQKVADQITKSITSTDALATLKTASQSLLKGKQLAIYDRTNASAAAPRFARQYMVGKERAEHTQAVVRKMYEKAATTLNNHETRDALMGDLDKYLNGARKRIVGRELNQLVQRLEQAITQQSSSQALVDVPVPDASGPNAALEPVRTSIKKAPESPIKTGKNPDMQVGLTAPNVMLDQPSIQPRHRPAPLPGGLPPRDASDEPSLSDSVYRPSLPQAPEPLEAAPAVGTQESIEEFEADSSVMHPEVLPENDDILDQIDQAEQANNNLQASRPSSEKSSLNAHQSNGSAAASENRGFRPDSRTDFDGQAAGYPGNHESNRLENVFSPDLEDVYFKPHERDSYQSGEPHRVMSDVFDEEDLNFDAFEGNESRLSFERMSRSATQEFQQEEVVTEPSVRPTFAQGAAVAEVTAFADVPSSVADTLHGNDWAQFRENVSYRKRHLENLQNLTQEAQRLVDGRDAILDDQFLGTLEEKQALKDANWQLSNFSESIRQAAIGANIIAQEHGEDIETFTQELGTAPELMQSAKEVRETAQKLAQELNDLQGLAQAFELSPSVLAKRQDDYLGSILEDQDSHLSPAQAKLAKFDLRVLHSAVAKAQQALKLYHAGNGDAGNNATQLNQARKEVGEQMNDLNRLESQLSSASADLNDALRDVTREFGQQSVVTQKMQMQVAQRLQAITVDRQKINGFLSQLQRVPLDTVEPLQAPVASQLGQGDPEVASVLTRRLADFQMREQSDLDRHHALENHLLQIFERVTKAIYKKSLSREQLDAVQNRLRADGTFMLQFEATKMSSLEELNAEKDAADQIAQQAHFNEEVSWQQRGQALLQKKTELSDELQKAVNELENLDDVVGSINQGLLTLNSFNDLKESLADNRIDANVFEAKVAELKEAAPDLNEYLSIDSVAQGQTVLEEENSNYQNLIVTGRENVQSLEKQLEELSPLIDSHELARPTQPVFQAATQIQGRIDVLTSTHQKRLNDIDAFLTQLSQLA